MAKSLYKLSRELLGHTGDVRGVAVTREGNVVSASRDKTAIFWKFQDGNCVGNEKMTGHSNFVSSVCTTNPSSKHPKGLIITGSNDSHVCVYVPGESQPTYKVKMHENTVCCVRSSTLDEDVFFSSSWDISAKLWNLNSLVIPQVTYLGHSGAVWCVSDLPNGSVVTGSADKTVIVYLRDGKILHKLQGHTDCVRDIAVINDNEFLSCANDAIIKHWTAISGDCLGNFYGHSNYIYSLSTTPGGRLAVSSGEDKTIRVWNNGEIDQTITLPAESVWCVKLLPNEDIVCGASDGVVRIFTANPERYADSETMQRFEEAVAHASKAEIEGLKSDNIVGPEALNQPGRKDGETKMVKEDNKVRAYSWSQTELKWNLIGDVMGANADNSNKNLYNGIEYDYIFSVDIEDGVPPLKLPYNRGQDPWPVAQKFIDDNNLSQAYLEQVANFIIKNSTPAPIVNNSSQFYDPFTGGSRYVPATSPSASQTAPTPIQNATSNTTFSSNYIPMKNFLKLEQTANLLRIKEKLSEFNTKEEAAGLSLPDEKLESVVKLATNQASVESGAVSLLTSLLNWPDSILLPVLDVARLAVLHKNVNDKFCTDEVLNSLRRHLSKGAVETNQMLTYRLLANLFNHEAGEKFLLHHKNELLNSITELPSLGNKNNQVAISTFILNLVVALNKTVDSAGKRRTLGVICSMLAELKETEAVFRVLVALGTLVTGARDGERLEFVNAVRQSENALNVLRAIAENSDKDKLNTVSKQIGDLIA